MIKAMKHYLSKSMLSCYHRAKEDGFCLWDEMEELEKLAKNKQNSSTNKDRIHFRSTNDELLSVHLRDNFRQSTRLSLFLSFDEFRSLCVRFSLDFIIPVVMYTVMKKHLLIKLVVLFSCPLLKGCATSWTLIFFTRTIIKNDSVIQNVKKIPCDLYKVRGILIAEAL